LITRIIFADEYRSLNSSLCSLLHSPVPNKGRNLLLCGRLRRSGCYVGGNIFFSWTRFIALRFRGKIRNTYLTK
jgi:hypothetical protein